MKKKHKKTALITTIAVICNITWFNFGNSSSFFRACLLDVPDHLQRLPGGEPAHAHVVLGAGRGREGIHARGVAKGLVLRN